jgi:hypothetical protein
LPRYHRRTRLAAIAVVDSAGGMLPDQVAEMRVLKTGPTMESATGATTCC